MVISFLEMILPNGSTRKFVKITIGLIVIIVIINPFISLVESDIDIEREILKNIDKQYEYRENNYNNFEIQIDEQIKEEYIKEIKKEVDKRIISTSKYTTEKIDIDIDEDKDKDNYGNIKKLDITLIEREANTSDDSVNIEGKKDIKDIKIDIKLKKENSKKQSVTSDLKENAGELNDIKNKISEKFEIDKDKIFIDFKTKD